VFEHTEKPTSVYCALDVGVITLSCAVPKRCHPSAIRWN